MLSLYFNDVIIPSWIRVTDITEEILPSIEADKDKSKLGTRKITVSFSFKRNKLITEEKRQELVTWIKGDNFNLCKLILPGRHENYYMAKVSNLSELSGSIRKGQGTITFTCYDEYINNNETVVNIKNNNEVDIFYYGSVDVYPDLIFNVTSACGKIKLAFARNEKYNYIELNSSFNKGDVVEVVQSKNKILVNGQLNMPIWHLNSKRSKLQAGINKYKLELGNCNVDIKYNERYL